MGWSTPSLRHIKQQTKVTILIYPSPKTKNSIIFKNDNEALKALANENVWNYINGQQAYDELYKTFYHFGKFKCNGLNKK